LFELLDLFVLFYGIIAK